MSGAEIHIRKANAEDSLLFFVWKNDPVTLANSFQSEEVPLEQHIGWFSRALEKSELLLLVGETKNGTPMGQVRFDRNENRAVVGVTVAPEFRGQKLSVPLLQAACDYFFRLYPQHKIDAYIKTENTASRKAFTAAGFVYEETTFVSGIEAIRMTLHP